MKQKKASRILKLLAKSAMIIFSVLLALIMSEWRTNYNEQVQTEKILINIKEEISGNQEFIETLFPYHEKTSERLINIIKTDSLEEKLFLDGSFVIWEFAPNGVIQRSFSDIVWTVAKSDQISNRISLEKSRVLFEVYEHQNAINITIRGIIDLMNSREIQRKNLLPENAIVLNGLFKELASQEKALNYRYKYALEFLSENE
jgi:hypothetical protein